MVNKSKNGIWKCDITYFEKIDSQDKAYWLGFLYADGCVSKDHTQTIISLSNKDKNHIEKFKKCIQADYPIYDKRGFATIIIGRKIFSEHLIDKGCVPAKTFILTFPDKNILPEQFIKYFILGYFDGDGCLSTILTKQKNRINPIMNCELNMLGTYDMLSGILNNLPIGNKRILKFGNIYKFRVQNKKEIIQILDYLYDGSLIYLERKHEKYLNNIKLRKTPRYTPNI